MKTRRELLLLPKRLGKAKRFHLLNRNWHGEAAVDAGADGVFEVFLRQNEHLSEHFSFGLRFRPPAAKKARWSVLLRLNGDHGQHRNPDRSILQSGPHVHRWMEAELNVSPVPGDDPPVALPLDTSHLALQVAWLRFCEECNLVAAPLSALMKLRSKATHGAEQMALYEEDDEDHR